MTKLYEDLGVDKDATEAEIKKAHREGVKKHHPDLGGDANKFALVTRAYMVLRDPDKRAKYDDTGHADAEPDNHRAGVLKFLATAFEEALATISKVETTDLMKLVDRWFADREAMGQEMNVANERDLVKLEKVLRRLKFKGNGTDTLGRLVEGRIDAYRRSIAQMNDQLALLNEARAMAVDYEYEVDAPPPPSPAPTAPSGFDFYDAEHRSVYESVMAGRVLPPMRKPQWTGRGEPPNILADPKPKPPKR